MIHFYSMALIVALLRGLKGKQNFPHCNSALIRNIVEKLCKIPHKLLEFI
jgi:hypothetical protein